MEINNNNNNNNNKNPSPSRTDRKTIEKNRRNHMKTLYSELNSLVPHHTSREVVSLTDQLDEAASYIKSLQMKLENMKEKKDRLMCVEKANSRSSSQEYFNSTSVGLRSPQVEIHEMRNGLEVILITGLDYQFMFNQTIRILHEEGADVVNANFSVLEDTIFHTIYAEVGESAAENGVSRISERIKKFVNGAN